MPTLNFVLKKGKGTTAVIRLRFHYGAGNRMRYSTGLTLKSATNWNPKTQRVKNVIEEIDKVLINNTLNGIHSFMELLYTRLAVGEKLTVTNEMLTSELDIFLNRNKKKTRNYGKEKVRFLEFMPFFKWYLEHYAANPLPRTKRPLSKATLKTYNNAYNLIKKFNDTEYSLTYNKITLDFYDDLLAYLYQKNLSTNYIGTQVKIIKTIMNASFEKGFHTNMDYQKRYFVKPSEQADNIYLDQEELLRIFQLDLSGIQPVRINDQLSLSGERLDIARDLFLIGANTGLRISDFNKLTPEHIVTINGNRYIHVETQKTGNRLTIPINPMVEALLNKRGGDPPPRIPDQHINYAVKILSVMANIDADLKRVITRGGKKEVRDVKKYELISSHTARRSFCTNAYKSGMPTVDIMAISGHKTEAVFYNYIKVNDVERAEKIRKHDFFTNDHLKIKDK